MIFSFFFIVIALCPTGICILFIYFQGWIDNFNGPSGLYVAVSLEALKLKRLKNQSAYKKRINFVDIYMFCPFGKKEDRGTKNTWCLSVC